MSFNVRLFGYSGIIQVGQPNADQFSGGAVFLNEEPCLWSQILVCDGSTVATSARIATVPDGTQMVCVEVPDGHEIRYEVVQPGVAARAVSSNSRRGSGSFSLAWNPGYTLSILGADTDVVATATATWDAATAVLVALTHGDLTATNTVDSTAFTPIQGVKVATASGKTSGKYYFEITMVTHLDNSCTFGVAVPSATYVNLRNSGTGGVRVNDAGGIYADGVYQGGDASIRGFDSGDTVGVAVDLDHRAIWMKNISGPSAPSDWNRDPGFDPATNIGGVTILAGTIVPFCTFGGNPPLDFHGNVFTANFGASAFLGAVPSGFISGWTA